MSYCQVNIGGKLRGLKFNNYALHVMQSKIDPEAADLTAAYAMVYAGLRGNCYAKSEQPDFTFEDVIEWVDSIELSVSEQIAAAFQESEAYKKTKAYIETVESAKKNDLPEQQPQTNTDVSV